LSDARPVFCWILLAWHDRGEIPYGGPNVLYSRNMASVCVVRLCRERCKIPDSPVHLHVYTSIACKNMEGMRMRLLDTCNRMADHSDPPSTSATL